MIKKGDKVEALVSKPHGHIQAGKEYTAWSDEDNKGFFELILLLVPYRVHASEFKLVKPSGINSLSAQQYQQAMQQSQQQMQKFQNQLNQQAPNAQNPYQGGQQGPSLQGQLNQQQNQINQQQNIPNQPAMAVPTGMPSVGEEGVLSWVGSTSKTLYKIKSLCTQIDYMRNVVTFESLEPWAEKSIGGTQHPIGYLVRVDINQYVIGEVSWHPNAEVTTPNSSPVATKCSNHKWKPYTGLNESFDYCEVCDIKRPYA